MANASARSHTFCALHEFKVFRSLLSIGEATHGDGGATQGQFKIQEGNARPREAIQRRRRTARPGVEMRICPTMLFYYMAIVVTACPAGNLSGHGRVQRLILAARFCLVKCGS